VVHDNHIKVGRNKLFKWLRDKKILQNDNTPYQIFIDHGYFKVVEIPKQTNYGYKIFTQTRVTTKGQKYIVNKLKDEFGIYDEQNKLKDV
jgi:phage antirepressor YoqD-like protein